jgi:hypothetical protein
MKIIHKCIVFFVVFWGLDCAVIVGIGCCTVDAPSQALNFTETAPSGTI